MTWPWLQVFSALFYINFTIFVNALDWCILTHVNSIDVFWCKFHWPICKDQPWKCPTVHQINSFQIFLTTMGENPWRIFHCATLGPCFFSSSLIKIRSPYGDRIKFCCRQNVSLSPSLCGFWFQSNWSRQFIYIDFYLCARKRIEFHRNAPLIRREMTVIKVLSWRRHFLHEDFLLANGSKVSKFPIKLKLAWFIRKWRCQINVKIFSQTLFLELWPQDSNDKKTNN